MLISERQICYNTWRCDQVPCKKNQHVRRVFINKREGPAGIMYDTLKLPCLECERVTVAVRRMIADAVQLRGCRETRHAD